MNSFSREGYFALKKETTENTAVTPDVFIPLMSEDVTTEYQPVTATPIAADRVLNQRDIPNMIAPPTGTISILLEPQTAGHFFNGCYGDETVGVLVEISSLSGDFTVGETITGGTSTETATVVKTSTEGDYILVSSLSDNFTVGETITGGTSSETATVVSCESTRNGHEFNAPSASLDTYTIEIGYQNEVRRFMGVRFNQIEFSQSDNIIQAGIGITARSAFHNAYITEAVSSGAGSQTINLDQTTGLVVGDTIKVYRDGTGYLDFSAASTKTHTIGTIPGETSITVTNLETSLQVGDLIVLAPQTTSYSIAREFSFIGGTEIAVEDNITTAVSASCASVEDFTVTITNTLEPLHTACGTNFVNRFPSRNVLGALEGTGSFTRTYTDQSFIDKLRKNRDQAVYIKSVGTQIGSTGTNYEVRVLFPSVQFDNFDANLDTNSVIKEEISYTGYASDDGYFQKVLLVNDTATY
jgi:hypothetical protein